MAQFNTVAALCHMLPEALRQKVCAISSVQARIAAFEGDLSGAAHTARSSHTPLPVHQKRFTATLMWSRRHSEHLNLLKHRDLVLLILYACSFKKKKRWWNLHWKEILTFPAKHLCFLLQPKPPWVNYGRLESTTILKAATQKYHVPSFPKVPQSNKLSLAKQTSVTKEPSLTDSYGWVENFINVKLLRLPEM